MIQFTTVLVLTISACMSLFSAMSGFILLDKAVTCSRDALLRDWTNLFFGIAVVSFATMLAQCATLAFIFDVKWKKKKNKTK